MIPGGNLLADALEVIDPQEVVFLRALGRTVNGRGRETVTYAAPEYLYGSFQPVSAARVAQLGLDATKTYAVFYASMPFLGPSKEGPADRFQYGGRDYDVSQVVSWFTQDGWDGAVAVDVGPTAVAGEDDGD